MPVTIHLRFFLYIFVKKKKNLIMTLKRKKEKKQRRGKIRAIPEYWDSNIKILVNE